MKRCLCTVLAGLLLLCGTAIPANGAVAVASSVAQFVTEPAAVSRMYAALDPGSQVYLVVWSTFSEVTKGQFLNSAGRAISTPFLIASGAGYARVARGADEFLVTYQRKPGQRWGRSVKYVSGGAPQLGNEFYIANVFVDSDAGMIYVPAAGHYLISSWLISNGYHSYVTGVKADGTVTIPTTLVTGTATDTASPEIACDFARSRCLMVGYGDLKRTWGRFFNASTGAMLSPLFSIDSGSLQEDHNVEWNATTQRFLVIYVRNRNSIAAKRVNADGSIDATAATVITGNYGQLGMSHNPATNSFLATFKDAAGNNQEYCWVLEFNGDGVAVPGQLWRISPLPTNGNAAPITVANAARKEYLFVQTRNYTAGDAGVLAATTPPSGGGAASGPPPPPPPPPPPATLTTAEEADFSGDMKADLLWRRTDGAVALWKMNGLTAIEQVPITPSIVDPAWKIVGTGDLDGNGRPEIIWQHVNGELCAWSMDGNTLRAWAYLNPRQVDPAWKVVAVADMNGDSKADLIFQNTSGLLVVWYMRGVEMTSFAYLTPNTPGDPSWKIVGAGDLNGDGRPDLVWRHQVSGELAVWLMIGTKMAAWEFLTPRTASGTDWNVGAVVDLNGDGKSDIVWQHTSGAVAAWLMNGITADVMSPLSPDTVGSGWQLAAPR
jgi:hypothetical protein